MVVGSLDLVVWGDWGKEEGAKGAVVRINPIRQMGGTDFCFEEMEKVGFS
jgi:hypothetical protein